MIAYGYVFALENGNLYRFILKTNHEGGEVKDLGIRATPFDISLAGINVHTAIGYLSYRVSKLFE